MNNDDINTDLTDEQAELVEFVMNGLPAMFSQDSDSNNWSYLRIIAEQYLIAHKDIVDMDSWLSVDTATGHALDLWSQDWGVKPIDSDEDFTRFMIRLNQAKALLGNTENDIIQLISMALGADPTEFHVDGRREVVGEPEAVKITEIPLKYTDDPRKTDLITKFIQESLATEVRLTELNFQQQSTAELYVSSYNSSAFINYTILSDVDLPRDDYEVNSDIVGNSTQQAHVTYQINTEED